MLAGALEGWDLSARGMSQIAIRVSAVLGHTVPPSWLVGPSPNRDLYARPLTALTALHAADRTAFADMSAAPTLPMAPPSVCWRLAGC